jgi:HK97 family phage portal protein
MGFINDFLEKRAVEYLEKRDTITSSSGITLGGNSNSIFLNENNITTIPAVRNGIDLISGLILTSPVNLYRDNNGKIEKILNDKRLNILNDKTSPTELSSEFWKSKISDMIIFGKSYFYIHRKGLEVTGISHIPYTQVVNVTNLSIGGFTVDREYTIETVDGKKDIKYSSGKIREINYGRGLLVEGKDILEAYLDVMECEKQFMKQGAFPVGALETAGRLNKETSTKLRDSWTNSFSGSRKAGKTVVLEEGLTYKSISQKAGDLMLPEHKLSLSKDIEKLFNFSSGALTEKIDSEIQHSIMIHTVAPIMKVIIDALNDALLSKSEKEKGYYFKYDLLEVERSSLKEKVDLTDRRINNGTMSINDVRYKFDEPPVKGGDKMILSLGNVFLNEKGELEVPNTNENINGNINKDIDS